MIGLSPWIQRFESVADSNPVNQIGVRVMKVFLLPLLAALFFFSSCGPQKISSNSKLSIVTTLFPQYDFARIIGGDLVDVRMLLPPGVEPHSFEPRPRDIVRISRAKLFIYTNPEMEPWVEKILAMDAGKDVLAVNTSVGIARHGHDGHEGEAEEGDHHDEAALDPHVWTDPLNAKIMVDNILTAMIKADPDHADVYTKNARGLKSGLDNLHSEYMDTLGSLKNRTVLYAGHFAFGYLAERYGLEHISPYEGFSPNAEPTPQKIAQLIKAIDETGSKTVFMEELIDPKVGRVIARQTGARLDLLHGIHNVTKQELDNGVSYIKLMRQNLVRLKEALDSTQ